MTDLILETSAGGNGRVALVTGAARGIGLGIAAWLVSEGWQVVLTDIDRTRGSRVAKVLGEAYRAVETDEDHHLYHTTGWCRELWIKSLGMPAVLPPPEEVKKVETAIGASRAEQQRDDML